MINGEARRPPAASRRDASAAALSGVFKGYVLYIVGTVALHLFGPWVYENEVRWLAVAFVAVFLAFVFVGLRVGINVRPRAARGATPAGGRRELQVVIGALLVAALLKVAVCVENLSGSSSASVVAALTNPGGVYSDALARAREMADVKPLGQVETLFGVLTQFALIGGFHHYERLGSRGRGLLRLLVAAIVLNGLMFRGAQIVIGALVIYWYSSRLVTRARAGRTLLDLKVVGAAVLALASFSFIQASRMEAYGVVNGTGLTATRLLTLNESHAWFSVLGQRLGLVLAVLSQYVSMGYYGLTLALQEPFVWTRGLGSSFALSSYAEQYLGMASELVNSYPLRVEAAHGWPALMYWQTAFPWLASDLSWPGTLLFLAFLASVYAVAWKESVRHHNLLSVIVVANLNVLWLFIPANNQLMQTRESAISTVVLLLAWMLLHTRFNRHVTLVDPATCAGTPRRGARCAPS
jgi:hypothetical protein